MADAVFPLRDITEYSSIPCALYMNAPIDRIHGDVMISMVLKICHVGFDRMRVEWLTVLPAARHVLVFICGVYRRG